MNLYSILFVVVITVIVVCVLVLLYASRKNRFYDFKEFKSCHFSNPKSWFAFTETKNQRVEGGISKIFKYDPLFSPEDFKNSIGEGNLIVIRTSHLKEFHKMLTTNNTTKQKQIFPFVLIAVDSDFGPSNFKKEVEEILENPYVIKMYCQNLDIVCGEKLEPFPIGVDYHTIFFGQIASFKWESWLSWVSSKKSPQIQEKELFDIKKKLPPPSKRPPLAYTSATLNMTDKPSKAYHAFSGLRQDLKNRENEFKGVIEFQSKTIKRLETWKKHGDFLFIVSPPGAGLDCHRTWEALALGNIPILVKTPPFTETTLFDNLPVVIVEDYSEITLENMKKWKDDFVSKVECGGFYNFDKLTVKYWKDKINSDISSLSSIQKSYIF